jgi:hypothetical protein
MILSLWDVKTAVVNRSTNIPSLRDVIRSSTSKNEIAVKISAT